MSKISGSKMLLKCLREEGVEYIFGYPGGKVIPIYDAIYDEKKIKHILVRHEQCAAHAADGYARATGRTGVCMATSGPGGTNLITGIANAYMDSIPIVAITGQVSTAEIGTDSFQEADITGITSPITKHNYLVKNVKDLPATIKEAFYIASTGRPGPVLIDIPVDVQNALIDENAKAEINLPGYKPTIKGHLKQIKEAALKIYNSSRPVIFAGGGVVSSGADKELTEFARLSKIPVLTSLLGKGSFPESDELSLMMAGMHGTKFANLALTEASLIIGMGVRFDDRVTGKLSEFAKNAEIIHIDIDPAEIGKNVKVKIPIVGDVKNVLSDLIKEYKIIKEGKGDASRQEWLERILKWKEIYPVSYQNDTDSLKPGYIIEKLHEIVKDKAIICTEVGQNQMWAAQFFKCSRPRTFISSGGLGTMGFGFPSSIGAQFGCPDKLVFDIAGDGSIQMVSHEFATAVVNKLPIKIILLNNGNLGMVKQWQELFYNKRYSETLVRDCVDFVKLVEAYGGTGIRVKKKEDVEKAIKDAININNLVLIDFHIDPEENVFPMVAPGAPISEMMVLGKEKK
ncbi:MAG TPA: biosynthetic-type acetolactate synthase large subunit [Actinobacteria bacterium]|jgi:acetolactate synthase-1/2/3 large subunit|nr:biosynthetic-type acetolactate synthase large subunit [Actinomycetota bacterium]